MDGIAATRAITTDDDTAGVRVVILTTFEIDNLVIRAVQAGASGFLGKGVDPAELLDAIRIVASGEALLSPRATNGLVAQLRHHDRTLPTTESEQFNSLTARERELTTLVATGLSNDDIAERLYLSPLTVKTHVNRAMMKLGAHDRAQLVVLRLRRWTHPARPTTLSIPPRERTDRLERSRRYCAHSRQGGCWWVHWMCVGLDHRRAGCVGSASFPTWSDSLTG